MPDGQRFDNVDLLRAFAACGVLVFHVIIVGWHDFPHDGAWSVLRFGWVGVDLFFVVSGFVIGHSAVSRWRAAPQSFAGDYWRHRLLRIVPAYFVALAAWIAIMQPPFLAHPLTAARQILTHVTFTHSFWRDTHGSIDGPTWSLAIEMQFYAAVAVLVAWLAVAPKWRIVAYAFVLSWAWRAFVFWRHAGDDMAVIVYSGQLPGCLDEFALGIALARYVLERRTTPARSGAAWLAAACVTGVLTWWLLRAYYQVFWQSAWLVTFWRTLLGLAFACLVGVAVFLPQSWARERAAPLRYVGQISYGIYLWHYTFIEMLAGRIGSLALLAVTATATFLVAAASWHWLEQPLMALARRDRDS